MVDIAGLTGLIKKLRAGIENQSGVTLGLDECATLATAAECAVAPPIDWSKPLRMVATHHPLEIAPVTVLNGLEGDLFPVKVCLAGESTLACFVSRNGIHADTWPRPLVENVPEVSAAAGDEVERFTVVTRGERHGSVEYVASAEPLFKTRGEALTESANMAGDRRIARVVIEEAAT